MDNNNISQSKPEEPNTSMPEQKILLIVLWNQKEKRKKRKRRRTLTISRKEIMKPKSTEEKKAMERKQIGEKITFKKVDKINLHFLLCLKIFLLHFFFLFYLLWDF